MNRPIKHLERIRLAAGLCTLALAACVAGAPPPEAVSDAFAHVHLTFET